MKKSGQPNVRQKQHENLNITGRKRIKRRNLDEVEHMFNGQHKAL